MFNNNTVLIGRDNIHLDNFEEAYRSINEDFLKREPSGIEYDIILEIRPEVKMKNVNFVIDVLEDYQVKKVFLRKVQ
jgi:hypothetical protein